MVARMTMEPNAAKTRTALRWVGLFMPYVTSGSWLSHTYLSVRVFVHMNVYRRFLSVDSSRRKVTHGVMYGDERDQIRKYYGTEICQL